MEPIHMGPLNAAVRFVAELVAVYGIGAGAWAATDSIVVTVALPLMAMGVWGTFRVPGDPGPAPIAVPGVVRLIVESGVFGGGAVGLWAAHGPTIALSFVAVLAVHHATSVDRLRFVLAGGSQPPTG
jgi:hypothetical protein